MFTAAALMTQVLSDSATTVLLGPIAVALADSLGMPAIPFVVCTALGAVGAFLTPIGHHGNLLILVPGQYRFADFLRIGAPLPILLAFVCAWMTQWVWLGGSLLPFGDRQSAEAGKGVGVRVDQGGAVNIKQKQ